MSLCVCVCLSMSVFVCLFVCLCILWEDCFFLFLITMSFFSLFFLFSF